MRVLVVNKSLCGYVSNQVQYNMESAQYLWWNMIEHIYDWAEQYFPWIKYIYNIYIYLLLSLYIYICTRVETHVFMYERWFISYYYFLLKKRNAPSKENLILFSLWKLVSLFSLIHEINSSRQMTWNYFFKKETHLSYFTLFSCTIFQSSSISSCIQMTSVKSYAFPHTLKYSNVVPSSTFNKAINQPSGFWPCVKSCLVGGSDKYLPSIKPYL